MLRELAVYYCQKCGFYGYYQLPKNAVCPKCNEELIMLDMPYQIFMSLDYKERDELLAGKILASYSIVKRIIESEKKYNSRETIAMLMSQIETLTTENKKLTETVEWMHTTIWDMLHKNQSLEQACKTEDEE